MADRVQAYNQASVPWYPDGPAEGHPDLDRRPHRAATSPTPSTSSSLINPYVGPAALYPGRRPPQTVHNSDIYFSPGMNSTRYDPLYPVNPAPNNPAQFYPPHQQQYYGAHNYYQHQARSPSPLPPVPVPPKPPALQQEARHDGHHGPLHHTMYRSFTSPPPVPPKPSMLFEPATAAIPTSAYLGSSSSSVNGSTAAPPSPPLPPGVPTAETPAPPETTVTQPQEEEDGDDLAVALALSKDESMREEKRMKELARLEDEEFERALAASMVSENARGRYDFYDSQPGAGPSNWASSVTQSSPPSAPILLPQEAGPSAPTSSASSSSSKSPSPDTSESFLQSKVPTSADKSKLDEPAQEKRPMVETIPQPTKRPSSDFILPNGTASPDHEDDPLPQYSPEIATSSSSLPPSSSPEHEALRPEMLKENEEDDFDGNELPYLRGAKENLTVSISTNGESAVSRGRLSPVSASFIDLSYDDTYIDEDEALARKLAEEEAEAVRLESQRSQANQAPSEDNVSRRSSVSSTINPTIRSELPTYSDAVSTASTSQRSTFVPEGGSAGPASRNSSFVPEVRIDTSTLARNEKGGVVRNRSVNSVASDPVPSISAQPDVHLLSDGPKAITLQPDQPQRVIGRVASMSALPAPSRSPVEDDDPPPLSDDELATPTNRMPSNPKTAHLTVASANATNSNDGTYSIGILNANHFIDAELLHGVSINFNPPVVSAKLEPMRSPLPTLISLPYGRCPPLHFQAPSWRHTLKLLARLSGTKIEPSIEALAVTQNEALKLRMVIQFIKPHHMSYEWRTILWFTIDHPVPPNIPNAPKYQTTNVNALPFSYTLSTIPAILRDASDTVLSKTYTIPATASVPYPSLPITFPSLALYLQAVLDDSRRQNDSSPLRKLAKMVQTCYPNDLAVNDTDELDKPSGVSGLFKKVIGRGNKKGKKAGGSGNEDTYDLVTPFVPDEWG